MASQGRNAIWITPEARTSFFNVYQARPNKLRRNEMFYDMTLLFWKSSPMDQIVSMIKNLSVKAGFGEIPPRSIFPGDPKSGANDKPIFKDGDVMAAQKDTYEAYKGHWVLTLSSPQKDRILVQDENRNEVMDPAEFQSGDYAIAAVEVSVYRSPVHGPQVSLKPKVVRKVRTGERFGGGVSAAEAANAMDEAMGAAPNGGRQQNGGGSLL